ncbi:DNA primase [Candidatus Kaiserbacteria bacterium CG10_big_fil_rev_8_21_14_0_10_59_10]|uniref:DNA primase n=1 Tax=Candidatus Kaiserbacteria bacterium CG10_big_fil_rev_8_21_14_0_10_59_10 TaxID=1974612 RepID=A0A2H0U6S8_9BACT|nr:MAG: DNA primase [Candidatus Kaiserbacteria bacterium CG10_big_fil_rev_8_21_14_0_10_59_10]
MADTVQQVKDKLSIVDVVSQYIKLERAGANMRARCPFHAERTPSFMVSPERGTYHCFGCGVGGDIFTFVEQIEGVDFKGALRILAERAGVQLVYARGEKREGTDRLYELLDAATLWYARALADNAEARAYLQERGIEDATVRAFRLGWASDSWSALSEHMRARGFSEKELLDAGLAKKSERGGLLDRFRNRIMFPIADSAGRVVGYSGRIFGAKASAEAPKYLNSPETALFRKSRILYGFDRAKQSIRKYGCAVLVEGQVDLVAAHQAGWANTVATSGTAFTPEHAALVRRMTENLVIALDADEAGFKAAIKASRAALAGGLNVKIAEMPQGKDPAEMLLADGADAWKRAIREAKDIITFLLDSLEMRSAGKKDMFRRAVESIVLPFIADVRSGIAREQYVHEVAGRLGVSESAVEGALADLPREAAAAGSQTGGGREERESGTLPHVDRRARGAFSLLLWQESLERPAVDTARFARELEESIGKEALEAMRALPESEREALRFFAERLYGAHAHLEREAQALVTILRRERFAAELAEATMALKRAEAAGNEEETAALTARCALLTGEIAKLSQLL